MCKASASQFLEAAVQDVNLREKFRAADNPDQFVRIARLFGYNFTTEELKAVIKENSQGVMLRRKTGVWPWLRTVSWL